MTFQESTFKIVSVEKGFIKPTALKIWKARKEVYVGYLDGTLNVYGMKNNLEKLYFIGSYRMHSDSIHRIYIMENLGFAVTTSFDSSLKVWQPPQEWKKKIIVSNSMIEGANPKENLSMIREDANEEVLDLEPLLGKKHQITAFGDNDHVVESLLAQI